MRLTQAWKAPSPRKLGDLLEGGQEGVLRQVVGQGRIGAHPAQQAAHRRAVPADQFAEGRPAAGRRQGDKLQIVRSRRWRSQPRPCSCPVATPLSQAFGALRRVAQRMR